MKMGYLKEKWSLRSPAHQRKHVVDRWASTVVLVSPRGVSCTGGASVVEEGVALSERSKRR